MTPAGDMQPASWAEASARARLAGLLDPGSFTEFLGPERRHTSPHLGGFDLPVAFDDGMIVGRGRLDGAPVLVAAQEGRFMGGAFGEVHGAKLVGLLRGALDAGAAVRAVLLLLDTGGVRLQEANAGEVAISEAMRALCDARFAGVPVIGLLGGRSGCFGGGSLIAACCGHLIMAEPGRLGVTGPEVIETNRGVEEFDARDRALVWRTVGGKHRRLTGGADVFVDDTVAAFRAAAIAATSASLPLDLATLEAEQARLEARLERAGPTDDALALWAVLGVAEPGAIAALDTAEFVAVAADVAETHHAAR